MRTLLRSLAVMAVCFGAAPLLLAQIPTLPQSLPANTVLGRLGIGAGPPQPIPFTTLYAGLIGAGGITGDVTVASSGVSSINSGVVTNAKLANVAGLSVKGNATTSTGAPTDITGTTRQVLGVNTGGTALAFAQPRGDQLLGSATNDSATAGNVGEFMSATNSGVSLSNNTVANITSITLTAGDWDIWGVYEIVNGSGTTTTVQQAAIATANNTVSSPITLFSQTVVPFSSGSGAGTVLPIGASRVSISGNTTYYINMEATFSGGTASGFGGIAARRRR